MFTIHSNTVQPNKRWADEVFMKKKTTVNTVILVILTDLVSERCHMKCVHWFLSFTLHLHAYFLMPCECVFNVSFPVGLLQNADTLAINSRHNQNQNKV